MKTVPLDYVKSNEEKDWDDCCNMARMQAVSYIGVSKKTSGKVAGWLCKIGYPDSIIEFVIRELKNECVLNDEVLAIGLLSSRKDKKAESKSASLQRLIRLGISREIAENHPIQSPRQ